MIIDVRADEVTQLRQDIRKLTQAISAIKTTAGANDKLLLTLHKLAVLLIQKPARWQTQAVALLKKDFALLHCRLILPSSHPAALSKATSRLPAGGKSFNAPLSAADKVTNAKRYFYLPLKQKNKSVGLLLFASAKADAFPDDAARDFSRRLAQLFSAALQ